MSEISYVTKFIVMTPQGCETFRKSYMIRDPKTDKRSIMTYRDAVELKEKQEELISIKFDRFRKIRNQINYYGKDIMKMGK